MKKFLVVVSAALVIALVLVLILRVQQANRTLRVTELLPKTTLVMAQVVDCKKAREQWHTSDLYALWQEPALQAWLEKPLADLAKKRGNDETLHQFLGLEPRDVFVALASIDNNDPKFIGGFHFDKTETEARRFVDEREAPWLAKSGSKREKIGYLDHQIETVNAGRFALATVYDRNWFFASNDLALLKGALDRADRRSANAAGGSLQQSELYRAATKHFSDDYAGLFFLDPHPFVEKLLPVLAMTGQPVAAEQLQQIKSLRSIAGTLGFDHGKMREATFVAMPRKDAGEKISRPSLATASQNTFFYSAALTQWHAGWSMYGASPQAMPAFFRQYESAFARAGVSSTDLSAAFGDEMEVVAEWPPEAHWPVLYLVLPVRDKSRAGKIADALASVELAGAGWTRSEKDGVSFYTSAGFGGFVPVRPTLALSDRLFVAGSDDAAVAMAVGQKPPAAGALTKSATFQQAEGELPVGNAGFSYLDPQLFLERADAALRPLLLMGATFYPALGNKLATSKLPPIDTITKHLSPIVMTQRFTDEGYLNESIGPVTFNEAAFGLAAIGIGAYTYFGSGFGGQPHSLSPALSATPSPTPP
ncbi:MAG: hypothetical protein H0X40_08215 [Chthoniobacterales bacterium]|nr:hypothetical protein [Chthoniobacterales bacterium]